MDKRGFMRELDYHLRDLSISERKDILEDYSDHFKIGEIDGKTEQDVVLELGSPRTIAQNRLGDRQLVGDQTRPSSYERKSNPFRSFFLLILLVIFNLIVVVGPAIGLFAVWISVWAVSISFTLAPGFWMFSFINQSVIDVTAEFFVVLTLTSIGVLIGLAMIPISKVSYRIVRGYLKWNVRLIGG
ncbi:DUF1700 domain-containing protein [Paraliobacillus sediminis]|uniref:DUF1700 domain-containing protein n=1 Tax=Paraliobacillus sediminis TaxID=1885916 RepID=UPI000E3E456A|nr:DUF1700 domain-containing protein [Paraliobacillus sediminis]